jgi:hypothetical protein
MPRNLSSSPEMNVLYPRALREGLTFSAFLLGYVVAFIGVPPIPICVAGTCPLSPRPEAFLLAAALAFGMSAILGVSLGVMSSALLYEAMNPMGTTVLDALFALLTFLVACSLAWRYLQHRPSVEASLAATWIVTGIVSILLGTYAYGVKGHELLSAYLDVLAEALIPLNVVGAAFLAWVSRRESGTGEG